MHRGQRILSVLLFVLSVPVALPAQRGASIVIPDMKSDSAAWQQILFHVVGQMGVQLVRTAHDTARQPWNLLLPAADPQRAFIETQLRTILRAREPVPGDSVFYTGQFGPLVVSHDTARVDVSVSETRRCRNSTRTTGFGWSEKVFVVRYAALNFAWGAARTTGTIAGDRAGCPSP